MEPSLSMGGHSCVVRHSSEVNTIERAKRIRPNWGSNCTEQPRLKGLAAREILSYSRRSFAQLSLSEPHQSQAAGGPTLHSGTMGANQMGVQNPSYRSPNLVGTKYRLSKVLHKLSTSYKCTS